MNDNDPKSSVKLESPHQKPFLTTPIGRFIEKASYLDIITVASFTIILSTLYFWLAPLSHTLKADKVSLLDAAYFSIVTFTSLGYGDLSPVGFGRFIAIAVVICGLIFIALLVGKVASERQQSILMLIHTSDCQRRIYEFTNQIQHVINILKNASKESTAVYHTYNKQVREDLRFSSERLEAISNYLIFNSNQAKLIEFGNESTLLLLYKKISELQKICTIIHKTEEKDLIISRRSLSIVNRSMRLIKQMKILHQHVVEPISYLEDLKIKLIAVYKIEQPLEQKPLFIRINNILQAMENDSIVLKKWSYSNLTPLVLIAVHNLAPTGTVASWPTGIHKHIAKQLNISNNLASKCLSKLISTGELPRIK